MVNPALSEPRETEIVVRGASVTQARWTQLTAAEMNAHNTFEQPDAVRPTSGDARVSGGTAVHTVAPRSVTKIELTIA
jgi:alpha-N-arabinofuranosidase